MDQQDEARLARALLAGEAGAFDRFVEHFRSKIFHYSWLMCGHKEDAEDVSQETLLRAFDSFASLRDPERVRAWVFRIARNACLMQRRRSVFAPSRELSLDELRPADEAPAEVERVDVRLLHSELRAVLDRVILELPQAYRAVVLLRDLEELSTEETAEILGLTSDVVRTRLHRGRLAMRQKMDCYVNNHCLEGEPRPDPSPLTLAERERLFHAWNRQPACDRGH